MPFWCVVLLSTIPLVVRLYFFFRRRKTILQSKTARTEYGALRRLVFIPVIYWFLIQAIHWMVVGIYVNTQPTTEEILSTNDVNSAWFPFFEVASSFHQTGFSLFPGGAGLIPLQNQPFLLLCFIFVSMCGDLAYPINLRIIVWTSFRVVRARKFNLKDVFQNLMFLQVRWRSEKRYWKYILTNPRRCSSYLFPVRYANFLLSFSFFVPGSGRTEKKERAGAKPQGFFFFACRETLWLVVSLLVISITEFFIFFGLEYNNTLSDLDGGDKFINALFTTSNTRHTGFNTLPIANLRPVRIATIPHQNNNITI